MYIATFDNLQNKIVEVLDKLHIIRILSCEHGYDAITNEHKVTFVKVKTAKPVYKLVIYILERVITKSGYERRSRLDEEVES